MKKDILKIDFADHVCILSEQIEKESKLKLALIISNSFWLVIFLSILGWWLNG